MQSGAIITDDFGHDLAAFLGKHGKQKPASRCRGVDRLLSDHRANAKGLELRGERQQMPREAYRASREESALREFVCTTSEWLSRQVDVSSRDCSRASPLH